ncbi:MAG TPA: SagB family peptide dehydrogenase [Acidimicrobiales bacterium]|nr:SagB family peptide dehydrogenase [Acidimicrobiales bacterium]
MLWDLKPPQFKTYPGMDTIALPDSIEAGTELDLAALGRLLFLSAGVVREMEVGGAPMWFRAAGSAGNLSPLEIYLVIGDAPGLGAGVYHYEPVEHALTRIGEVEPAGVSAAGRSGPAPALVVTGVPWRTSWKYRERGFRHLWWDAGTMLAQTLAVAEDMGWPARIELGFVDDQVGALVGADGRREVPLAIVGLTGPSGLSAPSAPPENPTPAGFLADDFIEFPLSSAAYQAGKLASDDDVESWQLGAATFAAGRAPGAVEWLELGPIDEVIRRRGSSREFKIDDTAPPDLLMGAMHWSTRPVPADFVAVGGTLLEHNLIVNAVDRWDAGAYRWGQGVDGLGQLAAGDLRRTARHLCLDQALGGDGAYTVFHCADVETVTAALGERGYRAALLESGVIEGRLHLAAYSMGYGASGLTFYDDEVKQFFDTSADPMLVTAIGKPTYHSRPGGLPGQPLRMARS